MKKKELKTYITKLLGEPSSPSELFHATTKNFPSQPQPHFRTWPKAWTTVFFKEYPRLDKIILPNPDHLSKSFEQTLQDRHSIREYKEEPLNLQELSTFLYFSSGLRDKIPPYLGDRFYASPGARYTLEVYLISQNTELPKGLYHYNLLSHSLETLLLFDNTYNIFDYFVNTQEWLAQAPAIFVVTSVFHRMNMKYGERGYRNVLVEAGHISQQYYLTASAMDFACCSVAGFLDDALNALLDVDGIKEAVVNTTAIGKLPNT